MNLDGPLCLAELAYVLMCVGPCVILNRVTRGEGSSLLGNGGREARGDAAIQRNKNEKRWSRALRIHRESHGLSTSVQVWLGLPASLCWHATSELCSVERVILHYP